MAHDYLYYDPVQRKSMAELVCELSTTLVVSQGQQTTYASLTAYLGSEANASSDGIEIFRPGPLMAVIALAVWSLSIFREVSATLRVLGAMLCLSTGKRDEHIEGDGGSLIVQRVWRVRMVLFSTLQFIRLGLAMALLIIGGFYLVRTLSVPDLIMVA